MNETRSPEELEKLLPWYVNGTLEGDELEAVERYIENQPAAKQQVAYLSRLRDAVKVEQVGSPGAFGLTRLQREISATDQVDMPPQDSTGIASLARWRMAAAVAGFVVVLQAGLLFNAWQSEPGYTPLGVDSDAQLVQVIFLESATEKDIRELLQEVGASISSGPGALGIYRLELDLQQQDADVDQVLERLRAATHVVSEVHLD